MRNRVTLMNHNKKKGDTIHVPRFTRALAVAKAAGTQVTLSAATDGVTWVPAAFATASARVKRGTWIVSPFFLL